MPAATILLSFPQASFTVAASPASVSGERATIGTATSGNTTATPTGGTPAYTYDWEYVSGDVAITPTADSSATTAFSALVGPSNPSRSGVWRCKVTDSTGAFAYSNGVNIALDYFP